MTRDERNRRTALRIFGWVFGVAAVVMLAFCYADGGVVQVPFELSGPDVDSIYMQILINGSAVAVTGSANSGAYTVPSAGRWVKSTFFPVIGFLPINDTASSAQFNFRAVYPGGLIVAWQTPLGLHLSSDTTIYVSRRESTDLDSIIRVLYRMVNTAGSAIDSTRSKIVPTATLTDTFLPGYVHFVSERWFWDSETKYAHYGWQPILSDTVTLDTVFDTVNTITPPSTAHVCNVWFNLQDITGGLIAGYPVTAQLNSFGYNVCDSTVPTGISALVKSSSTGLVVIPLMRSGCMQTVDGDSLQYKVTVGDKTAVIWVPDSSTYQIPASAFRTSGQ